MHRLRARRTSADFLPFMLKVVWQYPERELHVILDNSSSHGTPELRSRRAEHQKVHFQNAHERFLVASGRRPPSAASVINR
jgi:hypothetical protein